MKINWWRSYKHWSNNKEKFWPYDSNKQFRKIFFGKLLHPSNSQKLTDTAYNDQDDKLTIIYWLVLTWIETWSFLPFDISTCIILMLKETIALALSHSGFLLNTSSLHLSQPRISHAPSAGLSTETIHLG